MHRLWLFLGAIAGLGAVALSAWARHGAPARLDAHALGVLDNGITMQGWHALALVGTALWADRQGGWLPQPGRRRLRARPAAVLRRGLCQRDRRRLARAGGADRRHAADGGLGAARGLGAAAMTQPPIAAAYLAAEGFEPRPGGGAAPRRPQHHRLARPPRPQPGAAGADGLGAGSLDRPRELPAPSVKAAADALRGIQRNWALYAAAHHRRAALIEDRLPPVKARPLVFPEAGADRRISAPGPCWRPTGCWPARPRRSPFVNGEVRFVEDRAGPPSRAYLKLWEALTRAGRWPQPGETLPRPRRLAGRLDLGAGAARRRGHRRSTRRRSIRRWRRCRACDARRRAPSRSTRRRAGRSTGCSATSSATRPGCWRWCGAGWRPGGRGTSSAPSSSRARPTMPSAAEFAAIPGAHGLPRRAQQARGDVRAAGPGLTEAGPKGAP